MTSVAYINISVSINCNPGWPCLRIVHGNTRFSEDIYFDNLDIDENTFEKMADSISKEFCLQMNNDHGCKQL